MAVATANFFEQPAPFLFTKILIALFIAWVALFLILLPLFRIARYHKTMATGSDSSVEQRDVYERSFGTFLLAILAVAALESLPGLLDTFHERLVATELGWPALASAIAAATAVFSMVPRLLSALGKNVVQKLAFVAVGILGFLPPLLFILFVADFIVFSPPRDWIRPLELAGWLFPAGILAAVVLGLLLRAFRPRRDWRSIALLLVGALLLSVLGMYADYRVSNCCLYGASSHLDDALLDLKKRPATLTDLVEDVAGQPGQNLSNVGEWLDRNRAHMAMKRDFFSQHSPVYFDVDDKPIIDEEFLNEYLEYRDEKLDLPHDLRNEQTSGDRPPSRLDF